MFHQATKGIARRLAGHCKRVVSFPRFGLSTVRKTENPKLLGCKKAQDNYEELVFTMKKNVDIISQSFKGKGYNYLACALNCLLVVGLRDHIIVEQLIIEIHDSKQHAQITEPGLIERFVKDLMALSEGNPKFTKITSKMLDEMSVNFMFLKFDQIERIQKELISKRSNEKTRGDFLLSTAPRFNEALDKYKNISSGSLRSEIFCAKGFVGHTEKYEIIGFDHDRCTVTIKDTKTNQEIIIVGADSHAQSTNTYLKSLFKEKQGTINLLVVQDQPIPDFQQNTPQKQSDEYYIDEVNQMYKTMKDKHELSGMELRSFLVNCFNDESFVYNFSEGEFQHRNLKTSESLNTLYIDFIKQSSSSSSSLPAKIILADMPIGEYVNSLVVSQSLPQLRETVRLSNFVTLLEKVSFAHNTVFKMGCQTCNPVGFSKLTDHKGGLKKSPEAYLEVLTGDKNFLPIDEKTAFFADKAYQSIQENSEYKRVLVVCGGFHFYDVVAKFVKNLENSVDFDDYDFLKFRDAMRTQFGKKSTEFLEKIALLEVLHEVIDNGCVRELSIKGKQRVDFTKYIEFIDYYSDMLSFESIAPNIKFAPTKRTVIDSQEQLQGDCISDQLIFGLGEDKDYVKQENSNEEILSMFNEERMRSRFSGPAGEEGAGAGEPQGATYTTEQGQEVIIEDAETSKKTLKKETEQEARHYIDQVYKEGDLQLLRSIINLINRKTLFIGEEEEDQRTLAEGSKQQLQQSSVTVMTTTTAPKSSKFKKHIKKPNGA